MNDMATKGQGVSKEDLFKKVLLICPECKTRKMLNIPLKIINQSQHYSVLIF